MGDVTRVFAQIETTARTPEEIAERSGISISKVRKVLAFLNDFGFLETEGPRVRVANDIATLIEESF